MGEYHYDLGDKIRTLSHTADREPTYPAMEDLDTLERYLSEVREDLEAAEQALEACREAQSDE